MSVFLLREFNCKLQLLTSRDFAKKLFMVVNSHFKILAVAAFPCDY